MIEALEDLLSEQTAHGAFPSFVADPALAAGEDAGLADATGFVTAQVALVLRDLVDIAPVGEALDRALDFVEACAAPGLDGAFCFYPPRLDTPRLVADLPPDGDDTALAWLALMRGGRRTAGQARSVLPALFERLRLTGSRRGDPPWARRGLYRTWFGPDGGPPDACVNANILAVLAEAGCLDDGAVAPLNAALSMLEVDASGLRVLAPFYAHAAELSIALDRAVDAGVMALAPAAARASAPNRQDRLAGRPAERPLYCNAHGRPLWRAPSLQRARRCHDLLLPAAHRAASFSPTSGDDHVLHVQV